MVLESEVREKERRVREFLRSKGFSALLLKRQANFSWMTCGGLNLVGITTDIGQTTLLITQDEKFAITNNIEGPRIEKEELLSEQGYTIKTFPWYEDREVQIVKDIVGNGGLASDWPFPGATPVPEEVARLRYSLTNEELERYKWLGDKVSFALEKTLSETKPEEKESEAVGRLLAELWKDRIDIVTVMAAADERAFNFRHPIPTEKRVKRYLMVSVNARKWGLIVSLTRFVHFGKTPSDLKKKYMDNVLIDCTFMAHTRPGVVATEVLKKGIVMYEKLGYPDEWKLHHQGGSIGYTGRDYRTNFQTNEVVQENQAFTWNPSLTGTKSEDTIVAKKNGPEMITKPILYPTISVEVEGLKFVRPDILEKA